METRSSGMFGKYFLENFLRFRMPRPHGNSFGRNLARILEQSEQADGGGFEARGSSIATALHDEAEARGVPQSGSAKSGPCSIAQAAICVRELNPSFRSTLETWVSTVRLVILSSSAMRLLV